jgi:rhodanese-related sulfurtransferase
MPEIEEHVYELTPVQLSEKLSAQPGIRLIDIREPFEWELCRIEGAELLPMNSIPDRLGELGQDETIILYCHHGTRSAHALNFLYAQGYRDIAHLAGGINAWAQDIDSTMRTY